MSDSREGNKLSISKRITIRLSSETYEDMDGLLKTGRYETLSDIVRDALQSFLNGRSYDDSMVKVGILIPKYLLPSDKRPNDAITINDLVQIVLDQINGKVAGEVIQKISKEESIK
ncbi:MAG: ribbon-helix-helix domain-containing protein [Thermoplasmata archaeon]